MILKTHNKYKKKLNCSKNLIKWGSLGLKSKYNFRLIKSKHTLLYNLILQYIKKLIQNPKKVKVWSCITFNQNLTKLSLESSMGKGKGSIYESSSFIKSGFILFEFTGISKKTLNKIRFYLNKRINTKILLVSKYNN